MSEGIHHQQTRDDAIQTSRARDVCIGTRRPRPGTPFQAPAVPRYFVPRPEVSQALMDYLAADTPSGTLVVSAVHGLDGIGKTTLIAALAHAPAVQARFADGVLWATLGQQPDVLSLLTGWIQALGDYDFRPTVAESASAHLRTLLHDKACLLVVDDAWQADHVCPFLVGGSRCRLVVTTRNAALARKVDASLYDLDVMTEAQALALFQVRLGPLDGDREQAAALARELGYLPLALELAAAQVEAGLSWTELLDVFRQALADLAAMGLDEATYCSESLHLSSCLSLEQLSPDDQDAFTWLGVLPEDACLNPAMAATLWNESEAEARKRLHRLWDRALLKSVGDDRYTLHDLLHDEAKLRLTERMPLLEAHATLLARYRQKVPDAQWHYLPDDGYVYEHLTWHIEQAGQPEAIHALLREETAEGKNGWYQARDQLGQTSGYLTDVARAWGLAEEFAIRHSPFTIGLQCRYALVTASLNSLAKNIPQALLAALVKQGVWTPAQGLAYALQVPEPRQRAEALAGLASRLAALGYPEKALAVARAIGDEDDRAKALIRLVPRLAELGRPQEALAAAQEIGYEGDRAKALAALVPYLPEAERANALREALAAARAIENECWRAKVLVGLVSHLPEAERAQVLREALAVARVIGDKNDRATVLARLAPDLPEAERAQVLQEALAAVREIRWAGDQVEALAEMAPHLPEALLREALAAAQTIESEWWRAAALAGLAPHLPGALLREVLAAARVMENEHWQAEALAGLAPYLPEAERAQILREALAAARKIRNRAGRATVLAGLAPYLPEAERAPALREALAAAREIRWTNDQVEALAGLASHLPEAECAQALQEALAAARAIRWAGDRVRALVRLVSYLPEAERAQALREGLAAAWEIRDRDDRARALVGLAPHLPEPEREQILWEALAAAREIGDADDRAEVLVGLASWLAELGYPQEALAAAREIESEYWRAKALAGLAPHLPEAERAEALREALTIVNEDNRVKAPVWLVPPLAELGHPKEALAATREIGDADERARALAGLAPHLAKLSRQDLYPLWQEMLHFLAAHTRRDLLLNLGALSPVIAALGGTEAVAETVRAVQDMGRWWP